MAGGGRQRLPPVVEARTPPPPPPALPPPAVVQPAEVGEATRRRLSEIQRLGRGQVLLTRGRGRGDTRLVAGQQKRLVGE